MSRRQPRVWKPQDTISVRIPKDVDPTLLDWLSQLSEAEILQSTVIEALHRMHYDERGVETILVPKSASNRTLLKAAVATRATVQPPRNIKDAPVQEETFVPAVQIENSVEVHDTTSSATHSDAVDQVIQSALSFYD